MITPDLTARWGLASVHDVAATGAEVAGADPDRSHTAAGARADVAGAGPDGPHRASAVRPAAGVAPEPGVAWGRKPFADRREAGRALGAEVAARLGGAPRDVVVLGLPRGGVVVAAEVAAALSAPLDVVVVRKLGLPWQPELAMGAIAAAGDAVEAVRIEAVLSRVDVDPESFEAVRQRELTELRRREQASRGIRPPVPLTGRTVVVVDDGLATGATMRAAVAAVPGRTRPACSSPSPSAPRTRAPTSPPRWTTWSASGRRRPSVRWD